jgi:hypothetical protein
MLLKVAQQIAVQPCCLLYFLGLPILASPCATTMSITMMLGMANTTEITKNQWSNFILASPLSKNIANFFIHNFSAKNAFAFFACCKCYP